MAYADLERFVLDPNVSEARLQRCGGSGLLFFVADGCVFKEAENRH